MLSEKEKELLCLFETMDFDELAEQPEKYGMDGSGRWSEEFEQKCCTMLSKKLFENINEETTPTFEESLDNWFDNLDNNRKSELLEDLNIKEYRGFVR